MNECKSIKWCNGRAIKYKIFDVWCKCFYKRQLTSNCTLHIETCSDPLYMHLLHLSLSSGGASTETEHLHGASAQLSGRTRLQFHAFIHARLHHQPKHSFRQFNGLGTYGFHILFPGLSAYCKWSKCGGEEGLQTRLWLLRWLFSLHIHVWSSHWGGGSLGVGEDTPVYFSSRHLGGYSPFCRHACTDM